MNDLHFFIVTPVYKAQEFLGACIDSVLGQTDPDFQLILVDDGSPDDSGTICDEYAARDSRIHVIHQKNGGCVAARRAGIRYALAQGKPGDFLLSLDSDDSFRPNTLETVRAAISREDCDLVFFGMDNVSGGKVVHKFEVWRAFLGTVTDKRQLYKIVFGDGWYNPLCRKAVALELFDADEHPEWYRIGLGEDLIQSIPLYQRCRKVTFLPDVLYNYTVNYASITNSVRYDNYRVDSQVLEAVWNFLESENVWTEQDFTEYLCWCRTLTRIQVWTIAKFETALKNRYRLLEELRENGYFRMVLSTAKWKDVDLLLARAGVFLPLCLVGSLMKALGNLRRFVRSLKK